MTESSKNKTVAIVVFCIVAAGVLYAVLTMPDQRSTGQRIGDAIDELPKGVDNAARELERRTPGEKLGDAVKDAGEEIKESTDNDGR